MILRILKRSVVIVLLYKIVSLLASGNVCIKRFVGGKWVSHGNCQEHHDVIRDLKWKAETPQAADNLKLSCYDVALESAKVRNETGGVFDIYIPPALGWKEVYCDMTTDGGKWIVFQRRMDGSVDFFRNWIDYVSGFGNAGGELWLGLEAIHHLTKHGRSELRIDMIGIDGIRYYAKYKDFKIGPATDNYRLNASGYSGNASDAFANSPDPWGVLNGQQFSTKDADNDLLNDSCAVKYTGAWWYRNCLSSNLNGVYNDRISWGGVTWYDSLRRKPVWRLHMKFTEMKFRKKQ